MIKTLLVFIVVFMFILATVLVNHSSRLTSNEKKIVETDKKVKGLEFVTDEIVLYQTIEEYLWRNQIGMNYEEVTECTRIIYQYHKRYGIDGYVNPIGLNYDMILAMIDYESLFNKEAVSPAGALGLMQLMPFMMRQQMKKIFEKEDISDKDLIEFAFTPRLNLVCGLELMVKYQLMFMSDNHASPTDWKLALSYYNWSAEAVAQMMKAMGKDEPKASLNYAIEVEKRMRKYQELIFFEDNE